MARKIKRVIIKAPSPTLEQINKQYRLIEKQVKRILEKADGKKQN